MFRYSVAALFVGGLGLSACGSNNSADIISRAVPGGAHINNKTKFSQSSYGVAASPRVTTSRYVRKGGGRRQIGRPYKIRGKWYTPKEEPGYDRTGQASWYGPNFHGRLTANGEVYDQYGLSAAHPTFPLPSYARVTNTANGRSVIVRVNDRGPYHSGRIIDLSAKAAELLDYKRKGVANVRVQYIKQAPLHGQDHKELLASYRSQSMRQFAFDDVRPAGKFDPITTASTSAKKKKTKSSGDPFIEELQAIRRKGDTGSTLALRLRQQFILQNQN